MRWKPLLIQIATKLPALGHLWVCTHIFKGDGLMEGWSLGTPEYVTLLGFFTLLLFAFNWPWIDSKRPSTRLHVLMDDSILLFDNIQHAMDMAAWGGQVKIPVGGKIEAQIRSIVHVLRKIKVEHPPLDDAKAWQKWLPRLIFWAETKNVKEARQYRCKP